jgi:regulator of cell morphogenesis and NO signaling
MIKITKDMTLGEIVAHLPKATETFNAYNIDFCCGGDRSLEEAVNEAGLSYDKIARTLETVKLETEELGIKTNFLEMDTKNLIDYIVNVHHSYLNANLPRNSEMVNAVLRAHGEAHPELFEVHKLFHQLKAELEQHLIKEEVSLYPSMLKSENDQSNKVIIEIEDEHDVAGEILKQLREITQNYTVPQDGCSTYKRLYDKLEEMEKDIFNHIHLENNILHNRFN